jgi:hypothetical protein
MADFSACGEGKMSDAEIDQQINALAVVIEILRGLKRQPTATRPEPSLVIITPSQATAYCGRTAMGYLQGT